MGFLMDEDGIDSLIYEHFTTMNIIRIKIWNTWYM